MVSFIEINEINYRAVCGLKVSKEQESFVAPPISILARAYAKRKANAKALAIGNGDKIIGVVLFLEMTEEPACYTIEQFLIDEKYQNQGFGKKALKLVMELLEKERKYEVVEICVKKTATQALKVYQDFGFSDTGYTDPNEPDSFILGYRFSSS